MFAVPAGEGKLEKIFKEIFDFSAVPSRMAVLKIYSGRIVLSCCHPLVKKKIWLCRKPYFIQPFSQLFPQISHRGGRLSGGG